MLVLSQPPGSAGTSAQPGRTVWGGADDDKDAGDEVAMGMISPAC